MSPKHIVIWYRTLVFVLCVVIAPPMAWAVEAPAVSSALPGSTLTVASLAEAEQIGFETSRNEEMLRSLRGLISSTNDEDPWRAYLGVRYLETGLRHHDLALEKADLEPTAIIQMLEGIFSSADKNSELYVRYRTAVASMYQRQRKYSEAAIEYQRVLRYEGRVLNYAPLKSWELEGVKIDLPEDEAIRGRYLTGATSLDLTEIVHSGGNPFSGAASGLFECLLRIDMSDLDRELIETRGRAGPKEANRIVRDYSRQHKLKSRAVAWRLAEAFPESEAVRFFTTVVLEFSNNTGGF